jgi:hypothetical protein
MTNFVLVSEDSVPRYIVGNLLYTMYILGILDADPDNNVFNEDKITFDNGRIILWVTDGDVTGVSLGSASAARLICSIFHMDQLTIKR